MTVPLSAIGCGTSHAFRRGPLPPLIPAIFGSFTAVPVACNVCCRVQFWILTRYVHCHDETRSWNLRISTVPPPSPCLVFVLSVMSVGCSYRARGNGRLRLWRRFLVGSDRNPPLFRVFFPFSVCLSLCLSLFRNDIVISVLFNTL